MTTFIKKEKLIEHPLEEAFDLPPCTTPVTTTEAIAGEICDHEEYDAKDNEIEEKLEEIYTIAMGQVEAIADEMEVVEGKYKARVGEVTATMLNVALAAVKEKSALKQHKDKLTVSRQVAGTPKTLNQNVIVADRNELLRMMLEGKTPKPEKDKQPDENSR